MRKLLIALVVLIAFAMLPAAVSADVDDNTEDVTVQCTIPLKYEFWVLEDGATDLTDLLAVNWPAMTVDQNGNPGGTATPDNIENYDIYYWTNSNAYDILDVVVTDQNTGAGTNHMLNGAVALNREFSLYYRDYSGVSEVNGWRYITTSGTVLNDAPINAGTNKCLQDLTLGQHVVSVDDQGTYSITLVFTATASTATA